MKLFLYSIIIFLLGPCHKPSATANSAKEDYSKVNFSFQRTPCFGKCPAFTMDINGSTKTITYKGRSNVDKIGTYTKAITDDEIAALVKAFDNAHFFEFNDKYKGNMTDLPSTFTSYTNGSKTRKIEDMNGAPAELRELEKLLDTIANSDGWKKDETSDN